MASLTQVSKTTLAGTEQPETLRTPEIEKGIGCDFDSYLLVPDNKLDDRIAAAKAKLGKDVVILGHHYQRDEVVKFADFRGDSLKPSQQAAEANCWPRRKISAISAMKCTPQHMMHFPVVQPDLNAGCSMADMADIGQVLFGRYWRRLRAPRGRWARNRIWSTGCRRNGRIAK